MSADEMDALITTVNNDPELLQLIKAYGDYNKQCKLSIAPALQDILIAR
jgi:hypothetical protein